MESIKEEKAGNRCRFDYKMMESKMIKALLGALNKLHI